MFSATLSTCTVLLIDDDADILREYSKILERLGVKVITANDGAEAKQYLADESINVILTDLNMPIMGGLEFLRAVREVNLDVPIVLMTGTPELDTVMAAVDYGAFNYLTKPLDPTQLKVTVAQASQFHALSRLQRRAVEARELPDQKFLDRAALEARFNKALDQIWTAFQPIVRFKQRNVFAFEALVRSDAQEMRNPAALFEAAEQLGRTQELGRRIRQTIAKAAPSLPTGAQLFVNVNPEDLADEDLYSSRAALAPFLDRVVYEITERSELTNVAELTAKLRKLRESGARIAIDDLGAGYSSLSSFIHLEPDFVKLDMSLIRNVHLSPAKRSIIRGIYQLCRGELGVQVICEGVEVIDEVRVLIEEGLDLLQGFYFARPERHFPDVHFPPESIRLGSERVK